VAVLRIASHKIGNRVEVPLWHFVGDGDGLPYVFYRSMVSFFDHDWGVTSLHPAPSAAPKCGAKQKTKTKSQIRVRLISTADANY
jgi:hypothetical protein